MPGGSRPEARAAGWSDGPLVGRDHLLDELTAAAHAAARGEGSVVLLTGEAGIGKTTVARAVAQRVREQLAISWGACSPDNTAPPFWPWRALVAVSSSERGDDAEQAVGAPRYEQLSALRAELLGAVAAQPRVHVIEDLQWADVASVLLLAHVAEAIADIPFLVLATVRTGEPRSSQLEDAIDEVGRLSAVRALSALSDDDVGALLSASGTAPAADVVALVQARTGGNPLFVSELLRAVPRTEPEERRRILLAENVPSRVSDLIARRLSRLPAAVADALVTAAVLGSEGDMATLAAAHHMQLDALLDLLDQARAAHVLDAATPGTWRFRHQLVRDAVYAGVTGGGRARRHAAVAELLAAEPATPPAVVAHHALAAQPLFDTDRAVALAARAGEAAFAHHAYEEAVAWFERALAAAPAATAARWRAELLLLSGEAQRHIGDTSGARAAFVAAAELTDDAALLARAALGYADPGADLGIAFRTNDVVTAALLERAIAAQSTLDTLTGVQLETRLAAELYFSDRPAHARQLAYSALDRARRLGDPRALGLATAVVHDSFVVGAASLEAQLAESAQLLAWANETGSTAALLTAHRARVMDLLAAGDVVAMDEEVLAFRRLAEPLRVPGYLWWPELWSAMRALLEGRHDVAEERALATFAIGERVFPSLAMVNLSFFLFFLRREQGRLAEMEQATRDFAAANADVPAIRVALTFLLAEMGHIEEARSTLAAFDDAALARLRDRNWPASWFQLARAARATGNQALARTLLDAQPDERCVQVSLATVCLGATELAHAWLLETVGDLDGAGDAYAAAEDLNARIGARSWLAQARAEHAQLLARRGEATVADVASVASATFRREGSVWSIAFADRAAQLPDARGLRDLAFLLARRGEAVSVLELADDHAGQARGAHAFDEEARRRIRQRLRELDADEADAEAAGDGERAALVRDERQTLAEAVARDFGLGGRARRLGDPVERVRKTVSTRIRRAIATVARVHPELGRHLERSIDTGAWCAYRPAEPVYWKT